MFVLNSRIYFCCNILVVSNFYNNLSVYGGFYKCITPLWWRVAEPLNDICLSDFLHLLHWISLYYHNNCRECIQKIETVSWPIEAKARYQRLKWIQGWNKLSSGQIEESQQRNIIELKLRELEEVRPLSGNGYFEIGRGTLTSIVSTSITYFIILLQFKQSE